MSCSGKVEYLQVREPQVVLWPLLITGFSKDMHSSTILESMVKMLRTCVLLEA